ncbi:MAG: hypothetical protein A3J28_11460 [Acidobacteria bacterium RIFCSPLOWO2_12_FULL_60_22]|nr:MAG: hypothetical protein A3J28_11460 [Acidobacteria bacterium RIFCSPLOWO2_12_FULL_60_22]
MIEEGIQLAVAAVLAAVRAAGEDGPLDWSALRITETPEMALERARKQKSEDTETQRRKMRIKKQRPFIPMILLFSVSLCLCGKNQTA